MTIQKDYTRDAYFTQSGLQRLREGYMRDDEESPQDRFAYIAKEFASDEKHAQRMYDYASQFWMSFSSPILSYGRTGRGLPISCFASYLGDDLGQILETSNELRMMTVVGGGTGLHVGLRPADSRKSSGIIPHLKTYDADMLAYKQGTTRRGATAAYLRVDHPEIIDFLNMRNPTGGDLNRKCLNLHHGVCLTDAFMERVLALSDKERSYEEKEKLDRWELVNPHTGEVQEVVSVRDLWQRILTAKVETGEPYSWHIDTVNRALPDFQKKLGLQNRGGNLCAEISLATDKDRAFVCCLSPLNLAKWDEWKDNPRFVPDVVEFLDNVISRFILDAKEIPELSRAVHSAFRERAIGIGAMGWHDLLQKKRIAFESPMAVVLNKQIWRQIKTQAKEKTEELAGSRYPCPDAVQAGVEKPVRNSHLLAVAPTASTSYFLDTSPGCDPYLANAYNEKGVNGTVIHKNKELQKLLQEHGKDTYEVWSSIVANKGSVQQLEFLTEDEKLVFKTAHEIDQMWVVQHAADRQEFICQAQSTNLFVRQNISAKEMHLLHVAAWRMGLKSLYYCRSEPAATADNVGEKVERVRIEDLIKGEEICLACQ